MEDGHEGKIQFDGSFKQFLSRNSLISQLRRLENFRVPMLIGGLALLSDLILKIGSTFFRIPFQPGELNFHNSPNALLLSYLLAFIGYRRAGYSPLERTGFVLFIIGTVSNLIEYGHTFFMFGTFNARTNSLLQPQSTNLAGLWILMGLLLISAVLIKEIGSRFKTKVK
jgi:hypothetical protein